MYYTANQLIEKIPSLTTAEAERYAKIVSKVIDGYIGYNLLDATRKITFSMENPAKRISCPFGAIKSIIQSKVDGTTVAPKVFHDNIVEYEECISGGDLYLEVTAGHGATVGDIDGLESIFIGMVDQLVQIQKAKGEDGNLSSITIGELQKSYNTKISNEQSVQPLEEVLLQPYEEILAQYKYLFIFDNHWYLS